jgi:hypothetical protein
MAYRSIIVIASIAFALAFACGSSNKSADAPVATGSDAPVTGSDARIYLDAPGSGSGSGSGTMGVNCGSATCGAGSACCVGSGGTNSCIGSGSSCTGATVTWQGAASCGSGEVCCYMAGSNGGAQCTSGTCAIAACGSAADCPTPGDLCCAVGSSGFNYCGAHCF